MRGKKNEGKQEAENEMEPDKDDKREEDGDRQEKKQTGLSLCQTHYSPSHTHTHALTYSYNSYISLPQRNILLHSGVSVTQTHLRGTAAVTNELLSFALYFSGCCSDVK